MPSVGADGDHGRASPGWIYEIKHDRFSVLVELSGAGGVKLIRKGLARRDRRVPSVVEVRSRGRPVGGPLALALVA